MDFFNENGYVILNNIFDIDLLNQCKKEIINYKNNNKLISNADGYTIVDFVKNDNLKITSSLKDNIIINEILKDLFNTDDFRFCSHNDIGINRVVGWHKDKLNGKYSSYETINIWNEYEGEKHEIVKVLTYLEDHTNDNDGLKVVPGSHIKSDVNGSGAIQLRPKKGDVIIFDQRITHRGQERQSKDSRILVSMGFGKNNIFTDEFEKGTMVRQNKQNKI